MSEFDLKKSEKIGQLYPVLVDAKGNVIDGFHRLEADPNWRKEKIAEIDTDEKLLVARCVSNWHRRQVSAEEKAEWVNRLAEIYQKQGYKLKGKKTVIKEGYTTTNEILIKIMDVTGLSQPTVGKYLSERYKVKVFEEHDRAPKISAAERIEHELGRDYVERHREEVEEELRPKVEKEIRERIIQEEIKPKIKDELSRDTEFIREVIEKVPEVLPNLPEKTIERAKKLVEPKEMAVQEGITYTVGEYECPHCKKHYLIRCNGKRDWVE